MNILHVTTHMGGGIGRCLSDLVVEDKNRHQIIILQQPLKMEFIDKCRNESDTEIVICPERKAFTNYCYSADVVLIHWWHHPVMCSLLRHFPEVKTRLILWSHVSGCNYPYLSAKFIQCFDYTIVTSRYTWDNMYWGEKEKELILKKSSLVYGQGSLASFQKKQSYELDSETIKIGYVGTFARSKINADFVKACSDILKIRKNVKFIMVGDSKSGEWIKQEAIENGIEDNIIFKGYVTDVAKILKEMDIFGYPLNPYNFATTENSVLEAMAVGLPLVLLHQGTEKYIIDHERTGLLANDMKDYVKCIIRLIDDWKLRKTLGEQAAIMVMKKYQYSDNLARFHYVVEKVLQMKKTVHFFGKVLGASPFEWFISGVNKKDLKIIQNKDFDCLEEIFKENSKSSIRHFYSTYSNDKELEALCEILEKGTKSYEH